MGTITIDGQPDGFQRATPCWRWRWRTASTFRSSLLSPGCQKPSGGCRLCLLVEDEGRSAHVAAAWSCADEMSVAPPATRFTAMRRISSTSLVPSTRSPASPATRTAPAISRKCTRLRVCITETSLRLRGEPHALPGRQPLLPLRETAMLHPVCGRSACVCDEIVGRNAIDFRRPHF